LADSVQQALVLSGLGSEADADIKNLIEEHVQAELAADMEIDQTQKTNLEEELTDDQSLIVSPPFFNLKINYKHV